jgi:hypothetical protein
MKPHLTREWFPGDAEYSIRTENSIIIFLSFIRSNITFGSIVPIDDISIGIILWISVGSGDNHGRSIIYPVRIIPGKFHLTIGRNSF